jgi:hypothetical protein
MTTGRTKPKQQLRDDDDNASPQPKLPLGFFASSWVGFIESYDLRRRFHRLYLENDALRIEGNRLQPA